MKITPTNIKIKDLFQGYEDKGDDGVFCYNDGKHRLTVRPAYQREFIYNDKQRNAVIDTVMKGFPLNVMYWNKVSDDEFEVLDGQQRTISICEFLKQPEGFSIGGTKKPQYFFNLSSEIQEAIKNYELTVYVCEGTQDEKLEWFKVINIAGETLTDQELLNATYTGPWLADAKRYFSKKNCVAAQMGEGYVKGKAIRQEYLAKVLLWIADRDRLDNGAAYMAKHQNDADASDIWQYYQEVVSWAQRCFPTKRKGITDTQDWGLLYNQYRSKSYNANMLEEDIKHLMMDDEITKQSGIIPYLLSDRTRHDEKHLSLRSFTDAQKARAYESQNGKCAICGKECSLDDMQGDHKEPWSKGGRTIDENLQMLCETCNRDKSAI